MNQTSGAYPELSVGAILSNGMSIGVRNSISILLTYLLYGLTSWIPYLNIGTTIALNDLTAMLGRGESVSPPFIFDDKYRRRIGEYFIMSGLMIASMLFAWMALGAGIILGLGWLLAGPLFVDREFDGLESLRESYRLTNGHKLTIALAFILFIVITGIIVLIAVFTESVPVIIIVVLAVVFFILPMAQGMLAYIYNQLVKGIDSFEAGAEPVEPFPVH